MAESSTRTVDRALVLLGIVCDRGYVSLADAARDAELSASTALRLLRTLEAQEFIRRDPDNRYTPGARLVQLGALALANESLVSLARDAMSRMVEATGESCYLSVPGASGTALYIAIVEGTHSVRHASWVGRTIPLHGSAAGAVLSGETDASGFVVVRQGVEDDVTAIAVPVMVGARVIAALSSVIPSYRLRDEQVAHIGELLRVEAGSIVFPPAVHSRRTKERVS
ncbi:IclR family transcriptional regulator C-terminal domain-containing protein [Agreia sp. PsM10]|uniref:IclR family transcriptional regulator n=1 Tax=Agreia sp. PsM10 TaxID=3030533 RepID=UPI00263A5173|nr:helix-turn-helix domain-containing protein [Agreia sp. PsM10]MDN4639989.1 IclR family transcriptional regulator C-terminal domain-containing protein [Agreia sp. PsM10]